jgi:hypothetical protein
VVEIPKSIVRGLNVWEWFIKCFAGPLPDQVYLQVWDLFFSRMGAGQDARAVVHAVALAIFKTLGFLIEGHCENAFVDASLRMQAVKDVLQTFLGSKGSVLLSGTEASRFHADVLKFLSKLEREEAYVEATLRVKECPAYMSFGVRPGQ